MNALALMPTLPDFETLEIIATPTRIVIHAGSLTQRAACPRCQTNSTHRHSRYWREVQDLPLGERPVTLRLRLNRYRCRQATCSQQTFREQHPKLVVKWGRSTVRHTSAIQAVGLALGGVPGSRLAARLHLRSSRSTILRHLRTLPLPPPGRLTAVGVDDWALRKGSRYGTIIVDLVAHCVVALLPERSATTVSAWLAAYPTLEIVTRDRASDYIKGIQVGAPQAQQVADRWHLLVNLRETVERCVVQVYVATKAEVQTLASMPALKTTARESATQLQHHTLRQARFAAVQQAHANGMSVSAIATSLSLSAKTVTRWLQSSALPPESRGRSHASKVDPFADYLRRRWQAGCHDQTQLWREIVAQGFSGSRSLVAKWLLARRDPLSPPPISPVPPAKRAAWLCCRLPDALDAEQKVQVAHLLTLPGVERTYQLAQRFVRLLCNQHGDALSPWLTDALLSENPVWISFASQLQRDFAAIHAACSLPWSNGQVEGQVNRLKTLKRQMFGRAHLDLLQIRLCAGT